jgi:SAM-dependent methyltransferase
MHAEARAFIERTLPSLPRPACVVEIGSRHINGGVRDLLPPDTRYVGVDLMPGPGVDVVADGADVTPEVTPDLVLCCEVFEHTPRVAEIIANAFRMLAPGGTLLATCASDPRAPHSGHDGGALREGEHYANIAQADLTGWLYAAGFGNIRVDWVRPHGDLHAVATKLH